MTIKEFVSGAEVISRAAIHAGCNFFAGYPITPATPILIQMLKDLPKTGGIAIQAEDEIASIGFCIGASMTGRRVMTATSGPGISLYSENIGLAIMGEVPIVIINCQRMGPATGGATTTAHGDIQFMRWGTSGGYPVIVLAPASMLDCYKYTMKAFDLAEQFRVPVFLAVDKEIIYSKTTVIVQDYQAVQIRERRTAPEGINYQPYRVKEASDTPLFSPFGGLHTVRFTTSSHNQSGYLTKDPREVEALNKHLGAKINDHLEKICFTEFDSQVGAEILFISYGITSTAVRAAVTEARKVGLKVSSLIIHTLWPIPELEIKSALSGIKRIILPELNQGQYLREIQRVVPDSIKLSGIHRLDGGLISAEQILVEGELL